MLFRLDDSADPGLAKVEILGQPHRFRGRHIYRIKIVEIVKPSKLHDVSYRIGQVRTVAESLLIPNHGC